MTSSYEALSHPPMKSMGHKPRLGVYRPAGLPRHGKMEVTMPFQGKIKNGLGQEIITNIFEIAYTLWGDKGPVVLFLHGVPTNRRQWWPIQELVAPFARTISIDMLGMGESSHPHDYGMNQMNDVGDNKPWDWVYDTIYIDQLMEALFPGEKFVFVADDWGSGINSHYAANYNDRLLAHIQLDPIAFDGYPVSEIQAIGRASQIKDDQQFMMAMGAIDQTMVQIFKTMVHNPGQVYNQYSLRDIKFPYVDSDYERSKYHNGEDADSLTLRLKFDAIRTLADRAAILAPALLLPYHGIMNPRGVRYEEITVPSLIMWGEYDNMMPSNQIYRYDHIMYNSRVTTTLIKDAGHFAGTDQPQRVAEEIIKFLGRELGKQNLADVFVGYTGLWKGDEYLMIKDFRKLYGIDAHSWNEDELNERAVIDGVMDSRLIKPSLMLRDVLVTDDFMF